MSDRIQAFGKGLFGRIGRRWFIRGAHCDFLLKGWLAARNVVKVLALSIGPERVKRKIEKMQ
jgi:hypothetical protein